MTGTDAPAAWANWLRAALDAKGWIAADLARSSSVSPGTISKWLRGENPPGEVETVIEIAHILGAPDAIAALEAAGMHATADLIRRETVTKPDDPMIARIHSETALTEEQRVEWIEEYRRQQAGIRHYFELRIAEAQRAKHARRRGHAKQPDANGGEPRRQAL